MSTARRIDPRSDRRTGDVARVERRRAAAPPSTGPAPEPRDGTQAAARPGPAACVAVVVDGPGGRLDLRDRQAIAAARALADAEGMLLLALAFEQAAEGLDAEGVDAVATLRGTGESPQSRVAAVDLAARARAAKRIVFADTPFGSGDLGRRLAVRRGAKPTVGLTALEGTSAICRSPDPGREIVAPVAEVVLVASSYALPLKVRRQPAEPVDPGDVAPEADDGFVDLGVIAPDPAELTVRDAEFILAGGAGVSDWALFAQLAATLGATPAGSRVVVDAGLMPRDRQVGTSGATVSARLYLAFGISGAVQHLEGIAGCQTVVSVNRDESCAMATRADLSVVADTTAVMRELVALAGERP